MNMLIGVLCEVVSAVAATEKEELTVAFVKEKLLEVMQTSGLDEDGDNEISKSEFVKILEIPDACRCLQEVGVDVVGLVDLTDFLFEGDDEDEEGGGCEQNLTFEKFMEVVLQLRGSNNATVKDIVDLRKSIRKETKSLEEKLERALATGSLRKTTMVRRSSYVQGHAISNGAEADFQAMPSNGPMKKRSTEQVLRVENRAHTGPPSYDGSPRSPPAKLSFGSSGGSSLNDDNKVGLEERLCIQAGKLQSMVAAGHMELLKLLESIQEYKSGYEVASTKHVMFPGSTPEDDSKSVLFVNGNGNGSSKKHQVDLEELHTQMTRLQEALGVGLASLSVARDRMGRVHSIS